MKILTIEIVFLSMSIGVRLTSHLYSRGTPPYVMNLDPACREVPYPANIDIRDTVNYKQGIKSHIIMSVLCALLLTIIFFL